MDELQIKGMILGHAGDGNIHTVIFYPPEDKALRQKAEQVNQHFVERALAVMRQIKATPDPTGILNPGKVLGA